MRYHGSQSHSGQVKKKDFVKTGLHTLKGNLKVYNILIQVNFESVVLQKQML